MVAAAVVTDVSPMLKRALAFKRQPDHRIFSLI